MLQSLLVRRLATDMLRYRFDVSGRAGDGIPSIGHDFTVAPQVAGLRSDRPRSVHCIAAKTGVHQSDFNLRGLEAARLLLTVKTLHGGSDRTHKYPNCIINSFCASKSSDLGRSQRSGHAQP